MPPLVEGPISRTMAVEEAEGEKGEEVGSEDDDVVVRDDNDVVTIDRGT